MGPSGAGKTTLLDILAGRRTQNAGKLMLNGEPASAPMIRKHAAYVQQDDAIMASQTAREAVQMAALLTLPRLKYNRISLSLSLYTCIYIYIYIYV